MKKTKIIATIGPTSDDKEILKNMIENGLDILRVNMSHSDIKFLNHVVSLVNKVNKELNKNISIMVDTNGPSIQIGKIKDSKAFYKEKDIIRIYTDDIVGDNTKFSVDYKDFVVDVKINTILKINDGLIELNVIDKEFDYLLCEVVKEGYIEEGKKINVIGSKLNMPFLSKKDIEDIKEASKLNIDFLALSFVGSHEDVLEVNDLLINEKNDHMSIISKIENNSALDDLDEIIKVSDGVMVARGDLGVELPLERIPGIQKQIINKCHHLGKVSVVATEMMSSMEENLRPTRAEVSDIASAVLEGVDAVMLTGETTIGKHPIEVLKTMTQILEASENDTNYYDLLDVSVRTEKQDTTGFFASSVVECSMRLKSSCIVAPTITGYTARKLSRFRPSCPVLALSPDINTIKNLNIYYGIYPVLNDSIKNFDKMLEVSKEEAKKVFDLEKNDCIVITGGYPFKEVKHTNFMKIEEI